MNWMGGARSRLKHHAPKENVRPVRKVQLDKPRGSRLLHHSKLGSSPPLTTPSKLLFMEPRYQRDTSAKMALSERKHLNLEQISNSSKVSEHACRHDAAH
uniref:Uncharacterized protein n=1 Tax=Magallana gigas TaxID=29159 RepID=K1QSV7_MAGGI